MHALKSFHRFQPGTIRRAMLYRILFDVISRRRRKLEQTATDDDLIACFRKLPQLLAEVVMLADVQEFSYQEIQEALGIPIDTVMSRLSKGRQLLRSQLAECAVKAGIVAAEARA